MTSERQQDHLTPEVFVDVLEGSPVDASWRQHLESCSDCRQELEALEQTLAILKEDVGTAASLAPPSVERSLSRWWATAAAVVIAAGAAYWMSVDRSGTAPTSAEVPEVPEVEDLLPPWEQDEEFQFLLALSGAMDEELDDVASPSFEGFALEAFVFPGDLTPGERQRFVERLTEAMRSSL